MSACEIMSSSPQVGSLESGGLLSACEILSSCSQVGSLEDLCQLLKSCLQDYFQQEKVESLNDHIQQEKVGFLKDHCQHV